MAGGAQAMFGGTTSDERTPLSPAEEKQFMAWVKANQIHDLDHPDSHYDYRGFWKDVASKGKKGTEINKDDGKLHYPDTYKQHGHPTFSQESQYSRGAWDGGKWIGREGDHYLPQPKPAPSHRRAS